jgi:hypothetical protein
MGEEEKRSKWDRLLKWDRVFWDKIFHYRKYLYLGLASSLSIAILMLFLLIYGAISQGTWAFWNFFIYVIFLVFLNLVLQIRFGKRFEKNRETE